MYCLEIQVFPKNALITIIINVSNVKKRTVWIAVLRNQVQQYMTIWQWKAVNCCTQCSETAIQKCVFFWDNLYLFLCDNFSQSTGKINTSYLAYSHYYSFVFRRWIFIIQFEWLPRALSDACWADTWTKKSPPSSVYFALNGLSGTQTWRARPYNKPKWS